MKDQKFNFETDIPAEWLAATGYLFPENDIEYDRFRNLFPVIGLRSTEGIDPRRIISGLPFTQYKAILRRTVSIPEHLKMVALKAKKDAK